MARYDITKEAIDDLYRIWEYTVDTWSEDQADKYYAILEAAFDEIAVADNGRALIARVLHERMDYIRHFML